MQISPSILSRIKILKLQSDFTKTFELEIWKSTRESSGEKAIRRSYVEIQIQTSTRKRRLGNQIMETIK